MPSNYLEQYETFRQYGQRDAEAIRAYWDEISSRSMVEMYTIANLWDTVTSTPKPEDTFLRVDFEDVQLENGWALCDGKLVRM